jgi:hypothetical protein
MATTHLSSRHCHIIGKPRPWPILLTQVFNKHKALPLLAARHIITFFDFAGLQSL